MPPPEKSGNIENMETNTNLLDDCNIKADDVLLDYEADEPDETDQNQLTEKQPLSEGNRNDN